MHQNLAVMCTAVLLQQNQFYSICPRTNSVGTSVIRRSDEDRKFTDSRFPASVFPDRSSGSGFGRPAINFDLTITVTITLLTVIQSSTMQPVKIQKQAAISNQFNNHFKTHFQDVSNPNSGSDVIL